MLYSVTVSKWYCISFEKIFFFLKGKELYEKIFHAAIIFVTLSHTGSASKFFPVICNVLLSWGGYYTYMGPTPCEMAVKITVAFNLFFSFRRAYKSVILQDFAKSLIS